MPKSIDLLLLSPNVIASILAVVRGLFCTILTFFIEKNVSDHTQKNVKCKWKLMSLQCSQYIDNYNLISNTPSSEYTITQMRMYKLL